ncbi:ogr/Delta-like zinc finger family protein [Vibrio cholerae]|jgi:RNase P subunit RPR2|nr:transcriptional regulator [Vibrio parahaemolyticus]EGR5588474.1 transcriptional regulator [Vibrio cholerae]
MRIYCRLCENKALITKTNRLSVDSVDLYCTCPECGHRFVWSGGFKHSLNQVGNTDVIKALFAQLDQGEKRDLIHSLSGVCA